MKQLTTPELIARRRSIYLAAGTMSPERDKALQRFKIISLIIYKRHTDGTINTTTRAPFAA